MPNAIQLPPNNVKIRLQVALRDVKMESHWIPPRAPSYHKFKEDYVKFTWTGGKTKGIFGVLVEATCQKGSV